MNPETNPMGILNAARKKLIESVENLSEPQLHYRPDNMSWTILETIEHLVWTEYWTNFYTWKKLKSINGPLKYEDGSRSTVNKAGLLVNNITDSQKACTRPRWGGNAAYWINMLEHCGKLSRQLYVAWQRNTTLAPIKDAYTTDASLQPYEKIGHYFREHEARISRLAAQSRSKS